MGHSTPNKTPFAPRTNVKFHLITIIHYFQLVVFLLLVSSNRHGMTLDENNSKESETEMLEAFILL